MKAFTLDLSQVSRTPERKRSKSWRGPSPENCTPEKGIDELACNQCRLKKNRSDFAYSQLKRGTERRCIFCCGLEENENQENLPLRSAVFQYNNAKELLRSKEVEMKNKEIYIAELRASKENLQREKADLESQLGELRELLQTTASEVARVQTSNKELSQQLESTKSSVIAKQTQVDKLGAESAKYLVIITALSSGKQETEETIHRLRSELEEKNRTIVKIDQELRCAQIQLQEENEVRRGLEEHKQQQDEVEVGLRQLLTQTEVMFTQIQLEKDAIRVALMREKEENERTARALQQQVDEAQQHLSQKDIELGEVKQKLKEDAERYFEAIKFVTTQLEDANAQQAQLKSRFEEVESEYHEHKSNNVGVSNTEAEKKLQQELAGKDEVIKHLKECLTKIGPVASQNIVELSGDKSVRGWMFGLLGCIACISSLGLAFLLMKKQAHGI